MQDLKNHSTRRQGKPVARKPALKLKISEDRKHRLKMVMIKNKGVLHQKFSESLALSDISKLTLLKVIQYLTGMAALGFVCFTMIGSLAQSDSFFEQPARKIGIEGQTLLSKNEIVQATGIHPGESLMQWDPYFLASNLQQQPVIRSAWVRKSYPDTLHIRIREHRPAAFIKNGKSWLWISRDQVPLKVVKKLPEPVPVITGNFGRIVQGKTIRSADLERGMKLLDLIEREVAEMIPMILEINVSDPLNLQLSLRQSTIRVNLGQEQHLDRLKQFSEMLSEQKLSDQILSVDLRHADKIRIVYRTPADRRS
ncbi:MAG: FtsQ-type POTRA domain-containing protein [SAR324 cluster bacterium]|nr:FtsQ-type POTRA domain-containing protein [SAR324 cluster bacterium]